MTTTPQDGDTGPTLSIHKRPSGGRGEYELVGREGDITASDLWNRDFSLATPWGVKVANTYVGEQGGKRRFRLLDDRREGHIAPQLAAMLLLPPPTRAEDAISRALPIVLAKRYIMDIDIVIEDLAADSVVVRPTVLVARSGDLNEDHLKMRIGFDERVAQVRLLHQHADDLPEPLATLVRRHAASLESPREQIDAAVASATADIMKSLDSYDAFYLPGADPLAALRALSGLSDGPIEIPAPPDTPGDEPEVRLRAEHIYRLQRARGAQAAKFRAEVQRAYDFRCAFCGLRAPLVPGRMNAGVDAAHILPWGDYDLDVVRNGLMLCKQHHWAFDNRVLRLELAGGLYEVSFVPSAHAILSADPRTVALLQSVVGRIPADRLPISARNRPSALFLEEFNALAV